MQSKWIVLNQFVTEMPCYNLDSLSASYPLTCAGCRHQLQMVVVRDHRLDGIGDGADDQLQAHQVDEEDAGALVEAALMERSGQEKQQNRTGDHAHGQGKGEPREEGRCGGTGKRINRRRVGLGLIGHSSHITAVGTVHRDNLEAVQSILHPR